MTLRVTFVQAVRISPFHGGRVCSNQAREPIPGSRLRRGPGWLTRPDSPSTNRRDTGFAPFPLGIKPRFYKRSMPRRLIRDGILQVPRAHLQPQKQHPGHMKHTTHALDEGERLKDRNLRMMKSTVQKRSKKGPKTGVQSHKTP